MRWVPSFKTIMLRFFFCSCDFLTLMTGNDCDDILRHTAHIIEHRNLKKKKIYFAADLYLWVYDDSFSNENWGTDDDESGKGRSIHFLSSTQIAYSIMRFDLRLMILFRKQTLLIQWTCLFFISHLTYVRWRHAHLWDNFWIKYTSWERHWISTYWYFENLKRIGYQKIHIRQVVLASRKSLFDSNMSGKLYSLIIIVRRLRHIEFKSNLEC